MGVGESAISPYYRQHLYIPYAGVNLGEKAFLNVGVCLTAKHTPNVVQMLDIPLFFRLTKAEYAILGTFTLADSRCAFFAIALFAHYPLGDRPTRVRSIKPSPKKRKLDT
ncbi:hypothetical protein G7B40_037620 [Aetokthonos hydrillicola Thurmond2011]|jgi:hypothetical protein|uniref:Uncharacterized protein n=1 Tax=Aetokthonos hydrillicola Thurmond2011 TaxID=2712845 RepID=A0AAP5MCE2_9CYAN|nr:hypothetical protein [Aetokthonos hydrillicola CCALA 1050]MBW4589735.1 hypothetical protein [Aetokthonos hydrillicola CCALA 1050]MDR9900230.1 hypothetical protein [Aetokthonos hydrillicola Thurmond2011]